MTPVRTDCVSALQATTTLTLWGGVGGVWNTLVGVLIVNAIGNGMVVIGLPGFVQHAVLGLLVIAAVVLSTDRRAISFVK